MKNTIKISRFYQHGSPDILQLDTVPTTRLAKMTSFKINVSQSLVKPNF